MVTPQVRAGLPGHPAVTTRLVAWRRSGATQADEHCRVDIHATGLSLHGTVLGAESGTPVRAEYQVVADSTGLSTTVNLGVHRGLGWTEKTLVRAPDGHWTVDGLDAPHLEGCTDVDLGCTPATNTLPLRRLGLDVGASRTIRAAWDRFPELTVAAVDQTYTRLGERSYHYASGSYAAELTVDDLWLMTTYDEWRRTGVVEPS
ncbi:putative glycolipid-binding domain-containing protein [Cellulomonas sp. P24]|uniref:putative glycolipid-binding domain-containing protein n=1 Tax=Cellulomonas sp. P24 TaxID=2885206 RepID=UPI00216ABAAF|nr:putative glycolipid-binding domain-containing protein [Cellulomonas sp. P24]MCR6491111.1 putative glycolipid-binding domain-containing protein [Cellulomonas sp. P24]